MRYRQYRFKFYLNASHSIYINGNLGERHPHTWEIALTVLKLRENFVEFGNVEKRVEQFMQPYQDNVLNDVEPFTTVNPTLENCCEYFKDELKELLNQEGFLLLKIEMSETPTRTYVINLLNESKLETKQQSVETVADVLLGDIIQSIEEKEIEKNGENASKSDSI